MKYVISIYVHIVSIYVHIVKSSLVKILFDTRKIIITMIFEIRPNFEINKYKYQRN